MFITVKIKKNRQERKKIAEEPHGKEKRLRKKLDQTQQLTTFSCQTSRNSTSRKISRGLARCKKWNCLVSDFPDKKTFLKSFEGKQFTSWAPPKIQK